MKIITLFLTCATDKEADKITLELLGKKLVACVKKTEVASSFLWQGAISSLNEVLLIMDSTEEKFSEVEKVVRKIHSYKTFVLLAMPIIKTSKGVKDWLNKEISR